MGICLAVFLQSLDPMLSLQCSALRNAGRLRLEGGNHASQTPRRWNWQEVAGGSRVGSGEGEGEGRGLFLLPISKFLPATAAAIPASLTFPAGQHSLENLSTGSTVPPWWSQHSSSPCSRGPDAETAPPPLGGLLVTPPPSFCPPGSGVLAVSCEH